MTNQILKLIEPGKNRENQRVRYEHTKIMAMKVIAKEKKREKERKLIEEEEGRELMRLEELHRKERIQINKMKAQRF